MSIKNQKGFSLVELMVVVAIIGILSAIAIPNYQRFQARARQSSAQAALTGIFESEKAFFAQNNGYYQGLIEVGYSPDGVQSYVSGFAAAAADVGVTAAGAATKATFIANGTYFGPAAPIGGGATNTNLICAAVGAAVPAACPFIGLVPPISCGCNATAGANGTAAGLGGIAGVGTALVAGVPNFVAGASGNPAGSAPNTDQWTINAGKVMANTLAGVQ